MLYYGLKINVSKLKKTTAGAHQVTLNKMNMSLKSGKISRV
jgi:hypothetical protein